MPDPVVKHFNLTEAQVRKALLSLFKQEIRDLYAVDSFAMTSNGKFIVKLTKRTPDLDKP
jgi:hypothetical protein